MDSLKEINGEGEPVLVWAEEEQSLQGEMSTEYSRAKKKVKQRVKMGVHTGKN